jgi:hypothetical protein
METLQRTANRGSISTGFDIDNSLKFETDNTEYLERATGGGNGSQQKHTISVWVKRTELSNGTNTYIMGFNGGRLRFETNDIIEYQFRSGRKLETNRKFRDTSAWYHIVVVADSSLATSTDRMKLYINGVRETDLLTYIPQDQNQGSPLWGVYNTYNFRVGGAGSYSSDGINGYLAEVYYINGQTLDPTDFGEFDDDSGIWKPKAFTGTLGSLDNYLDFSNSSNLGEDANGGTDLSPTNITAADQATDTPTNNFCTLNPLFTGFNSSVQLPLNGATQYGVSGGNQDLSYAGTMGVTKGKWYFENYINEVVATYGARIYVGFHTFQQDYDGVQVGASTNGDALAVWQMDAGNYVAWNGGSRSITSGLGTVGSGGAGKFVGIALNLDDNQISFYYDGSAVTNGTNLPLYNMGSQTDDGIFAIPVVQTKGSIQTANFGGYIPSNFISSAASDANGYGTFEYAPPAGYYALCTKNLAEYG